uniref:Fatty acid hydroxylase domain-containing protein n=1 Tax=viral metagenome TaxID=1070528 RepID=A0A6C0DBY4_9ZZZZ
MLSTIIFSTKFVIGIFSASTLTAFLVCFYNNIHFVNPKQNRYRFIKQSQKIYSTLSMVLGQTILVYSVLLNRMLDNKMHNISQSIYNITLYSIIAEFFYYLYHRAMHTEPYYKEYHSNHHQNIDIFPFDTFYIDKVDAMFLLGSIHTPILFIRFNYFELGLCLYLYITFAYLAHSDFFTKQHVNHHKLLICNYCILNPIYDVICRTYR